MYPRRPEIIMKRISLIYLVWVTLLILGLLSPAIHAAETIKVAAIFAKTGDAATPNLMFFYAARFAVEKINKKGGLLGKQLELMEIDNQSTALGSKAAAEQAVKDGVSAVIGASRSSYALAMAPALQAAKIPMISPTATIPEFTLTGDYIFRACFVDDFQGAVMAAFAIRDLKAQSAVVLTNTGNKYSMGLAKVFVQQYKKDGGKILMEGEYLENVTDFRALLEQVRHLNPQVVFIPGYSKDTGFIMKTASEMGIKLHYLGGDGWSEEMIYQYAGDAVEESYCCSHWNKDNPDKLSRWFVESFERSYGRIVSYTPSLTYDAFMLLANAIKRANSIDTAKIREALAATKGFKGVTGEITYDGNRNPVNKPAVILKYGKKTIVYVKTIKP
jgi:branched-chain amino acid transport system substrate-binding protein